MSRFCMTNFTDTIYKQFSTFQCSPIINCQIYPYPYDVTDIYPYLLHQML